MKYLIAGLGNIGSEYAETRHNIGFKVLDALAAASNAVFRTERYGDVAEMRFKGRTFLLLKPSTYMNNSGNAVRYWLRKEKVEPAELLVVLDALALPLGTIRMRAKGNDGGHNGLKDIIGRLGTQKFMRVKIGVGAKPKGWDLADHVLGRFGSNERKLVEEAQERACKAVEMILADSVDAAMNQFNKKMENV